MLSVPQVLIQFFKNNNHVHHEGKKDLIITDGRTNKKFIIKNDGIYKIFGFYGMIDFVKREFKGKK